MSVVTWGVEQTPNKSQYAKLTLERKILLLLLPGSNWQPFNLKSGSLKNKPSWLPLGT